jgi:hypothetical protein
MLNTDHSSFGLESAMKDISREQLDLRVLSMKRISSLGMETLVALSNAWTCYEMGVITKEELHRCLHGIKSKS